MRKTIAQRDDSKIDTYALTLSYYSAYYKLLNVPAMTFVNAINMFLT